MCPFNIHHDDDCPVDPLDAMHENLAEFAENHPDAVVPESVQRWAATMRVQTFRRLAEHRRNLLPKSIPPVVVPRVRSGLLAMTRDQLLAKLEELARLLGGDLQIAYRRVASLTDDDLRRLLETLDPDRRVS